MRWRSGTRVTIPRSVRASRTSRVRLGLLRTGGSDWHGDPEPGESHGALGSQEVPLEWLERLDALRGKPAGARGRSNERERSTSEGRSCWSPGSAGRGRSATPWRSPSVRPAPKIVACDQNAVGVAERVREFAAAGVDARPCAGDLTHARHRRARRRDCPPPFREARRRGQRGGWPHHLRPDRGAHRRGARP